MTDDQLSDLIAWSRHLRDDERDRLQEIVVQRAELMAERRRIYDRCRKRMARS